MNKLSVILTFLFTIFAFNTYAQKFILLDYARTHRSFNLEGAEIYFIIEDDSIFLTKTGEYEFRLEPDGVLKLELSQDSTIEIQIKTFKWVFTFQREKEIFESWQNFLIRFSKYRGVENVTLGYAAGEWVLTPSEFTRERTLQNKCNFPWW